MSTYQFLQPVVLDRYQAPSQYGGTRPAKMSHSSYVMGDRVQRPGSNTAQESGYQVGTPKARRQ